MNSEHSDPLFGLFSGKAPFGWQKEKRRVNIDGQSCLKGFLVPHPEQADIVRSAFLIYINGNLEGMKRYLTDNGRVGSRSLYYHFLSRALLYTGKVDINGEPLKHQRPAIIDEKMAYLVLEKLDNQAARWKRSRKTEIYPLSGLIICDVCGHYYTSRKESKRVFRQHQHRRKKIYQHYYGCIYRIRPGHRRQGRELCSGPIVRMDLLHRAVIKDIKKLFRDDAFLRPYFARCIEAHNLQAEIDDNKRLKFQQIIQQMDEKMNRLIHLLVDPEVPNDRTKAVIAEENQKKQHILGLIDGLTLPFEAHRRNYYQFRSEAEEAAEGLQLTQELAISLIDKIVVKKRNQAEIYYKIWQSVTSSVTFKGDA